MEIAQPNDPEVMTANLVDNEIVFVMRTVEQLFMIENILSIKPVEFKSIIVVSLSHSHFLSDQIVIAIWT